MRNPKIILFLLMLFITEFTSAQPVIDWVARFNGLLDSTDVAVDIVSDNSGNTYVTGYSNSLLGLLTSAVTISYDPAGNQRWRTEYDQLLNDEGKAIVLDNAQQYVYVCGFTNGLLNLASADYIIIKYRASDGQQMWVRTYNNILLSDDKASDIAIDSQNNIVVTGYSQGFLLILTPYDYATLKYDQNGNLLWLNRYNGTGNNVDKAYSVKIDNSDNIIVTGESSGLNSGADYTTVKYSPNGNQLWEARYNGPGNNQDRAYAIIVDNSDNIIVTGESVNSSSNYDYATVKYAPNGSQQWAARYNGPGNNNDRAYAIIVDNSDNIIVTGESTGNTSDADYTTVKYDPSGSQLWEARYNGPGNNQDRAYAIIVDNSDNIYVTGSSRSTSSAGSEDYATLMYNPSGSQQWVTRYNGTGNNEDRAYAIIVDNSDNIYVTGSSRNGALLGTEDYLTIKYSESKVVGINNIQNEQPSGLWLKQNYPNPFNPETMINFDVRRSSIVTIKIIDNIGNVLKVLLNERKQPGSYSLNWDAVNLSSGIYYCRLEAVNPENYTVINNSTIKMLLIK
ncbi:MAG: PKD repeat protein [Chlorobi bacterium OLB5]|nr:MAG: PKD repeat protein [Chlorobi bacterium OLB5]